MFLTWMALNTHTATAVAAAAAEPNWGDRRDGHNSDACPPIIFAYQKWHWAVYGAYGMRQYNATFNSLLNWITVPCEIHFYYE